MKVVRFKGLGGFYQSRVEFDSRVHFVIGSEESLREVRSDGFKMGAGRTENADRAKDWGFIPDASTVTSPEIERI